MIFQLFSHKTERRGRKRVSERVVHGTETETKSERETWGRETESEKET